MSNIPRWGYRHRKITSGFTVIEVIVVVAILGILATIILVNYGQWQRKAVITKLKSDLNGASAAMDNYRNFNKGYPDSVPSTFTSSDGVVLDGGSLDGGSTFCLTVTYPDMPDLTYYVTSNDKSPREGSCNLNATVVSSNKNINTDTISSSRSCPDAINYSITALTSNTATLSSTPAVGCLLSGDEVLLINLGGTSSNYGNVGNYETKIIRSVSANIITFTTNKTKHYGNGASDDTNIGTASTNQRVMLQRVPSYTDFTIDLGATLTASAWNGIKGGVIFIRATGKVQVDGIISVAGRGWRGGSGHTDYGGAGESYRGGPLSSGVSSSNNANGGGGGGGSSAGIIDGHTGGAGGAGHSSAGQAGGRGRYTSQTGGGGGSAYGSTDLSMIFFGSGGGGNAVVDSPDFAAGGTGGGIIIIACGSMNVSGGITANGTDGQVSGHYSSGGSGGSIYIQAGTGAVSIGTNKVTAKAGASGNGAMFILNVSAGQSGASRDGRIRITGSLTGNSSPAANNS